MVTGPPRDEGVRELVQAQRDDPARDHQQEHADPARRPGAVGAPREDAAEYAGRTGYWAARAVRALAYALVFMPLTAVAAGPLNLFVQVSDGVMAPVRWWRRLRGSKPAREAEGARTASDDHPGPTSLAGARDLQVLEAAQRLGSTRPSR